MYGLIGKIKTIRGERDVLTAILLKGIRDLPGCLSYVVAHDPIDEDALWITEVWESPESHRASLSLPSVQRAILRSRPFIAGINERFETRPVGGHGLAYLQGDPPAAQTFAHCFGAVGHVEFCVNR
jgi:quinol monooxygenase YgiN